MPSKELQKGVCVLEMTTSYLINEIYPCLQGEGTNIGLPALLVRFQICNLRCTWCDTPYTHTFKSDPVNSQSTRHAEQKFKRYTLQELIAKIEKFKITHLIFSGGEPTLQNLGFLMRSLGYFYTAEVESNGTRIPHKQMPNFLENDYTLMQWNISPKFSNAGAKIEPKALAHWAHLSTQHEKVYFKFVIRETHLQEDFQNTLMIIKEYNISNRQVILMPEGCTIKSQVGNIWLHELCLKYGFRYSPRLHVLLFENQRGV